MNCPGGDVMSGIGMIAKYSEHIGSKRVKVDGQAASMAAYFCAMSDDVDGLDVSQFLIHRAAFPEWVEKDKNLFTEEMKAMLIRHNDMLRASLERKIDPAKFKRITGRSFDDIFSMDSRIDVNLNASQALSLGLISKITPLNKVKKREINALASTVGLAAFYSEAEETTTITNTNSNTMTIADVKANADVYAALKAEILAEEKDRIEAIAAFKEIDPKACIEAIEKGEKYTASFAAKMQVKAFSQQGVSNMAAAATTTTTTVGSEPTAETTQAQKEVEAFSKGLTEQLAQRFKIPEQA